MKKLNFTRFISFVLAMLFLVSTVTVAVSAAADGDSVTDKSIKDYVDALNTISYETYIEENAALFANPDTDFDPIVFDAKTNWVFEAKGETTYVLEEEGKDPIKLSSGSWNMVVEVSGEDWTLTVVRPYVGEDGKTHEEIIKVYDDPADVVAAGIVDSEDELVALKEYGTGDDRKLALYTPGLGTVTWTLDLGASGITEKGLYTISLSYWSVVGKSAAAEREFYINGEAPFSEARSLTLPKLWSSFASYDNKTGATTSLYAEYKLGKNQSAQAFVEEAQAVGLTCLADQDDSAVVYVEKPAMITKAINDFIEKYSLRFFSLDDNRNELRPTMVQTPEWSEYDLRDSEGFYANDLGFVLTPDEDGKVTVSLKGVNEAVAISEIVLRPYTEQDSYAEYYAKLVQQLGELKTGTGYVKLEAENTTHTSTNVVYPVEDRTSALSSPADPTRMVLNTIGGEKWATSGQWAEYAFTLDASGMYDIFSRYKQSYLDGMYVCRSLQIYTNYESADAYKKVFGNTAGYYDGVPFSEASALRYNYGTDWQVTSLNNGEDLNEDGKADTYQIYFEKGVQYTIRFEVTLGTMSEQVRKIEAILDQLNSDYLSIIKLTGTSPDDYRDYNFSQLLPDTLRSMLRQAQKLREVSAFLKETAKVASTYSGTCDKLEQLLTKLAHDPDSIAKNLDNLKSYVGNLGTFLSDAKTQPLQLDYITIQGNDANGKPVAAPKAAAGFFRGLAHEFNCFIQSFFRDYNSMGATSSDDAVSNDTVVVWLAYGRDQSQVIRNLSTNEFTPETHISVDLKLVSGGTLLPSILAGMGPDVYLGLADATVINYAIRGALTNIEKMDGFGPLVDAAFTEAAMIQLEIADAEGVVHTYGLPETQAFQMMFVRLDILGDLGIEIPKTWDDLFTAQSKLESNNMEIGVTTNYKVFLYQSEGNLYADDGMRINLDSEEGLKAFETMCSMFTQKSFPYSYNAANRFRTGEMPIILADYTGLYNQLKVFATEIDGSWTFVPIPGTLQEDGTVNNTADSTINAVVMINGLSETDQASAWEFMKWYTGGECQSRYANEMVAIIGDSAKHNTANRLALYDMPWTRDELKEVEKQFENLAAIPNYPGSYYLDRHTNFAFLAAYNDNANPSDELLSYINTINNEITRKREEFKLETLEIGQTLAEKRMDQAEAAIEALIAKVGEEKYQTQIAAANYAIANQKKIDRMYEAALGFSALLEYDFVAAILEIEEDAAYSGKDKVQVKKDAIQAVVDQTKTYDFYKNVSQQTSVDRDMRYDIDSLNEMQLVYFIAESLRNAADALASY